MQDTISQYIQQQLEVARLERQRRDEIAHVKAEQEVNARKAQSLANTIRALSLLGIEAGEDDLSFDEKVFGYYLLFNKTIRLSLQTDGKNGNWFRDEYYPNRNPDEVKHNVFGVIIVSRVIPDEYRDSDDGGLLRGFYWSRYISEHRIDFRSQEPINRLGDNDLFNIFSSISEVEKNFANDEKDYLAAHAEQQNKAAAVSLQPKFTYTGDSREEILSQLLNDIANRANLDCPECGRKAVDPIDFYCKRCGVDVEF
jgi:hypothetical protein